MERITGLEARTGKLATEVATATVAGEYEVKSKTRFTQALCDHAQFGRDKTWLDGQTQRWYVAIELADAGDQAEPGDTRP